MSQSFTMAVQLAEIGDALIPGGHAVLTKVGWHGTAARRTLRDATLLRSPPRPELTWVEVVLPDPHRETPRSGASSIYDDVVDACYNAPSGFSAWSERIISINTAIWGMCRSTRSDSKEVIKVNPSGWSASNLSGDGAGQRCVSPARSGPGNPVCFLFFFGSRKA